LKIKADFVTNSSSTSYVIAIPKNFDPVKYVETTKNLYEVIDRFMIHSYFNDLGKDENPTEQQAIDYYVKCFIESFSVKKVTIFNETDHPDNYTIARDFAQHLGFILATIETSEGYEGTCVMVPEGVFQKLLTKVNK